MKKTSALKKFLKPVLGILGLAIVIVWSGGFLNKRVKPSKVDFQPGIPLPEDAGTVAVQPETAPVWVEVIGTTASEEKINLTSRIPAYVAEVFVSAGDTVKKGPKTHHAGRPRYSPAIGGGGSPVESSHNRIRARQAAF